MKTSSGMLVISIIPTKTMFCVGVEMRGLSPILNRHRMDSPIWTPDQRMAKFQVSNPYFKLIPTLVGQTLTQILNCLRPLWNRPYLAIRDSMAVHQNEKIPNRRMA